MQSVRSARRDPGSHKAAPLAGAGVGRAVAARSLRAHARDPGLRPFVLVVLAAWAVRVLFLLRQPDARSPMSLLYWGDAPVYLDSALALVQGRPYDSGIPFHPPGFTALVAAALRLTGIPASPAGFEALALKILFALLGAIAIGLFFLLARRIAGRAVALAAAPLAIFSFGHAVQSTAINAESAFLLLALAVVLGWSGLLERIASLDSEAEPAARRPGIAAALAAVPLGLAAGAAALMRPEFLLTALLLLAVALALGRRRALLPAALFVAAGLALIAPWTLHCRQNLAAVNQANAARLPRPLPEWVFVSAGGPLNFATANNDRASGAFDTRLIEALVPGRPALDLDLADPEINRLYIDGYAVGAGWMLAHPDRALALMARKLALASDALSLGYLGDNLPAGLTGERRPVDQFVPRARWFRWVQLALCALGVAALRGIARDRRSWTATLLLGAHGAATLLTILAFFGYARFGMLLAPIFWILIAAGALRAGRWVWERTPPRARGAAARRRLSGGAIVTGLIALLLAFEAISTTSGPREYAVAGSRLPGSGRINPDDWVEISPGKR